MYIKVFESLSTSDPSKNNVEDGNEDEKMILLLSKYDTINLNNFPEDDGVVGLMPLITWTLPHFFVYLLPSSENSSILPLIQK